MDKNHNQSKKFREELIRKLDIELEVKGSKRLGDKQRNKPTRIRRVNKDEPLDLVRLNTGNDVLNVMEGAVGYSLEHDPLETKEEVDLIAHFLQTVGELVDWLPGMGPADRVQIAFELTQSIKKLTEAGFGAYGKREILIFEAGEGEPTPRAVGIIHVYRKLTERILVFYGGTP